MEKKLESTLRFYVLATKLKYKIRTGWDDNHWNISGERRESVAEHVYSTCILAIALESECNLDLDLEKVIMMLVLHELGEVIIGDITPFDNISREEKIKREYEAIKTILGDLRRGEEYYDLLLEFDEKKTKEAIFAYHCDKMDADLQSKIYQDMGCHNPLTDQKNNIVFKDPKIQQIVKKGAKEPYDVWYEWAKSTYKDDELFHSFLDYVKKTDISEIKPLTS